MAASLLFLRKAARKCAAQLRTTRSIIDGTQAIVLADTFKKADRNGDGVLSSSEIKENLAPFIGVDMSEDEVEAFIARADLNNDGMIDYAEFVKLVSDT